MDNCDNAVVLRDPHCLKELQHGREIPENLHCFLAGGVSVLASLLKVTVPERSGLFLGLAEGASSEYQILAEGDSGEQTGQGEQTRRSRSSGTVGEP
eukprot:6039627-Pleurochrysis_carterae.AAC.4